ncbi:sugar O-acyltransferase, sialic acid O-acetyltransferase NeuD family [Chitinophaga sp. CF118]|uniref:acetyltransferase n=1 Tax=Chitinophaga sp. CF118 TaxID=1884367 RepID=UPI0008EB5D10|nr:acetyltransferase [Chitinophaga sp. CF118]SFD80860.1 sugar O-acyltransferase, sialic acid O-acetyltransferase NeuD family [Chitinophaga sp. CF118]
MMYLYGASGHAKVIIEILEMMGIPVAGLFDDNSTVTELLKYSVTLFPDNFERENNELIISIGNNKIRKELSLSLNGRFGTAIHPKANISGRAVIKEGSVVMGGVTINADARIGKHCIINSNASVDHDCVLGDYVHISPNAVLCGNITVGEGVHIGAGAIVIPGVNIGNWAVIGAGAVVTKDVPGGITMVGNPAKRISGL